MTLQQLEQSQEGLAKHLSRDRWNEARDVTITDNKLFKMVDLSPLKQLEEIWLNRNKIQSIECMWAMEMKCLKKFSVSHNVLRKISIIRKLTIPHLDQLQLDHNKFHGEDKLGETQFYPKTMIWISYDDQSREVQWKHFNKCLNNRYKDKDIKMRQ